MMAIFPCGSRPWVAVLAAAVSGCGGGSSEQAPAPPPLNNAPILEFAVTPPSGYAPVENSVIAECSDPDGDAVTLIVFANDQELSTSNPADFSNLITDDTSYRAECTDSTGRSATPRTVDVDVKLQEIAVRKSGGNVYTGEIAVDEHGNPTNLINEGPLIDSVSTLYASYDSDGRGLYVTVQQDGFKHSIYSADADDGSELQDITSHLSGADSMKQQDLCSNGEMVVAYLNDAEEGLGIVSSDGNVFTAILTVASTPISLSPSWPSWNDDCSEITFAGFDGNWDIYKVSRDGTNLLNLTNHPAFDSQPSYSLDGTSIAFVSDSSEELDICAMDSDGNNQVCFSNPGEESDPSLSLEGYIISVNGGADFSNHQLEIRKIDGTGLVRLTSGEGGYRYPAFRPRQYVVTSFFRTTPK